MDIEQFRKAGYQAIDRICDYYSTLAIDREDVTSRVSPGYLRKALPEAAPEKGEEFQAIADDYQELILPGLTHWQHPSFFAYFPTASTFEGILGDLYASSVPNPGFNWSAGPASTELEAVVMDWASDMFGLNAEFKNVNGVGGGVMQTSASDSALTAVVAARSRYVALHPETPLSDLVIYTTTQTHSLGTKAGLVLGLSCRALEVTAEDHFALRGETLRLAIEEDHAAGKKPFILIATVGTTSSGAVDRVEEIGPVLIDHPSIWLHIDAAWAGVALACPEYREQSKLEAINKYAHSFCTNFHKWGLVNFDASALWVREHKNLTDALDVTPPFLRTTHGDAGTVIDYRNFHLGLGRRFRSLKLWFVLRSYGIEGFQNNIRKGIALNDLFVTRVRASENLELVVRPSFALSVFRLVPKKSELSLAQLNTLNKALYSRISQRHDILLTQTEINGVFCIRFAPGAERTTDAHIERAFGIIQEAADETTEASAQTGRTS